jgi:renalase
MNPELNKNKNIAVIGAGIAGLSCANTLEQLGFKVDIYEKSSGPSGRMSTRRGDGWSADHGAQYFTARSPELNKELNVWLGNNIVAEWQPKIKVLENNLWRESIAKEKRYVAVPNMNSLGKHLATKLSVQYKTTIHEISRQNNQWTLNSVEFGTLQKSYDHLVIAIPAPQATVLCSHLEDEIKQLTASANMDACWTMMAHFPNQPRVNHLEFDAAFINQGIISWLCRNTSKPGRSGLDYWTIQATPEWSNEWIEATPEIVTEHLLMALKDIGFNCEDAQISTHRWRYARGHVISEPKFYLSQDQQLSLCGDWLHGGRVEGAWLSGHHLAIALNNQ